MGKRLPLPVISTLPEVVLFHRDHPTDPRVTLQIPNRFKTDGESYIVRLDQADDKHWMDCLPNSAQLLYTLTMEQHVAYYPATGHQQIIPDLDAPTPVEAAVAEARQLNSRSPVDDRMEARKRLPPRRHMPLGRFMTPLRRMLGGRGPVDPKRWFGGPRR